MTQSDPPIRGLKTAVVGGQARPPVVSGALSVLDQCDAFVRMVDDAAYARESEVIAGGTIGKHVRHILDHFRAVVEGHDPIDYDHRDRDVPMERNRADAMATIRRVRRCLEELDESAIADPVGIRVMVSEDGCDTVLGSTVGRELAFAAHHAVHHHAMLRAIGAEMGFRAEGAFGKAPSTVHHERGGH